MTEQELNKIIDFIQDNLPYNDRSLIKDYIQQHEFYGTCDYELDEKGEVIYIARWNITGNIVFICDFAVRKEYRNKRFVWCVLIKNLKKHLPQYPQVRFVEWKRGNKYPNRKQRIYSIYELLRRNVCGSGFGMIN